MITYKEIKLLKNGEKQLQKMEQNTKISGDIINHSKEEIAHKRETSAEKKFSEDKGKRRASTPKQQQHVTSEHICSPDETPKSNNEKLVAGQEIHQVNASPRKSSVKKNQSHLNQEPSLPVKLSLGERIQQLHIKGLVSIQEPRTPVRVFHEKYECEPASNDGSPMLSKKNETASPNKSESTVEKVNDLNGFPNPSRDSTPTMRKSSNGSIKKEESLKILDAKTPRLPQNGFAAEAEESKKSKMQNILRKVIPTKHSRNASAQAPSKSNDSTPKPRYRGNSCIEARDPIASNEVAQNVASDPKIFASEETSVKKKKTAMTALTDAEKQTYGDRFPPGYQKLEFLGRYDEISLLVMIYFVP